VVVSQTGGGERRGGGGKVENMQFRLAAASTFFFLGKPTGCLLDILVAKSSCQNGYWARDADGGLQHSPRRHMSAYPVIGSLLHF